MMKMLMTLMLRTLLGALAIMFVMPALAETSTLRSLSTRISEGHRGDPRELQGAGCPR